MHFASQTGRFDPLMAAARASASGIERIPFCPASSIGMLRAVKVEASPAARSRGPPFARRASNMRKLIVTFFGLQHFKDLIILFGSFEHNNSPSPPEKPDESRYIRLPSFHRLNVRSAPISIFITGIKFNLKGIFEHERFQTIYPYCPRNRATGA